MDTNTYIINVQLTQYFIDDLKFRVSTNLTEQISRRFPGDSRRDFEKNPGHVCIASACYVMYRIYCCDVVCLNIEQKHDMHFIQHGAVAKIK